jgi:hypothetical protein
MLPFARATVVPEFSNSGREPRRLSPFGGRRDTPHLGHAREWRLQRLRRSAPAIATSEGFARRALRLRRHFSVRVAVSDARSKDRMRVGRASREIIRSIPYGKSESTSRSVKRGTTSLRRRGLPRVRRCGTARCVVPKGEDCLLAGSTERHRHVHPEGQHQNLSAVADR